MFYIYKALTIQLLPEWFWQMVKKKRPLRRHVCKSNGSQINRRRSKGRGKPRCWNLCASPPLKKSLKTKKKNKKRRAGRERKLSGFGWQLLPSGEMTTRTHCPSSGDLVGGSRTQFAQICRRTKGTRACAAADKRTDCRTVAFRWAAHWSCDLGSRILQDCVLHEQPNSSPKLYAKVSWWGANKKKRGGEEESNATFY